MTCHLCKRYAGRQRLSCRVLSWSGYLILNGGRRSRPTLTNSLNLRTLGVSAGEDDGRALVMYVL